MVECHPACCSSIVGCQVVDGNVAPGSCVKRGEGDVMLLTSTLSVMRGVVVCHWH